MVRSAEVFVLRLSLGGDAVVVTAQGVVRCLSIVAVAAHMQLCTLGVSIGLVRNPLYRSVVSC